jgi:hypothetical protein
MSRLGGGVVAGFLLFWGERFVTVLVAGRVRQIACWVVAGRCQCAGKTIVWGRYT